MAWQTRDLLAASGVAANVSGTYPGSTGLNVEQDLRYSWQVVFDYAGAASGTSTGTVAVQASDDGINYATLSGISANYTSGTTNVLFEVTSKAHKYSRLLVNGVTGTGGKLSAFFHSEYDTE
jgi:squalene cyclase